MRSQNLPPSRNLPSPPLPLVPGAPQLYIDHYSIFYHILHHLMLSDDALFPIINHMVLFPIDINVTSPQSWCGFLPFHTMPQYTMKMALLLFVFHHDVTFSFFFSYFYFSCYRVLHGPSPLKVMFFIFILHVCIFYLNIYLRILLCPSYLLTFINWYDFSNCCPFTICYNGLFRYKVQSLSYCNPYFNCCPNNVVSGSIFHHTWQALGPC